ncbi:MAG TPA: hypothetical protein PLJ60_00360 [Chryseolinea sp.]|nr:hypothetical protein [Chryseolinea sp.]HPM28758.1 hypothetical protein [Chryseolinea sp.]
MKTPAKNFKGIVYIQLNDLPIVQQELLLQSIHKDIFIKILIGEKVISNCLQYTDYELWYNNIYKVSRDERAAEKIVEQKEELTKH